MSDKPSPGWYTKAEMARIFGTNVRNFDATYRRYAAEDAVKTVDARLYFNSGLLIRAMVEAKAGKVPVEGVDPLLAGGTDSPALEEYRKARARLAWMEVEMREKTHVPLMELEPALMRQCSILRQAGDNLARQYGNDAAMVLNEAVDQWEESLEKLMTNDTDTAADAAIGERDPHAATADDARVR